MKTSTVKNAVDAHGWVGLFISVPLFLIFWAGAVTLFYPEVQRWSAMPHYPLSAEPSELSLTAMVEDKIADYEFDSTQHLSFRLPGEHSPYIQMHMPLIAAGDVEHDGHNEADHRHLMIDPNSGETLSESEAFQLADFMNRLHFTLKLPQGLYIVGVVTFFFLVLVMTGIVIQLKNLIKNFFLYRNKSTTRSQMNDLHTVVGVISLPYGLMYALTGVMFNLSILFQVTTMMTLYQGDMQTMLQDAGFAEQESVFVGEAADMPDLNRLIEQAESDANMTVRSVSLQHYGDEGAIVSLSGNENGSFARRVDRTYEVATQEFSPDLNQQGHNLFADGVNMMFSLHMANYAGFDLRFLYFVLAIGVCAMIVAGNVLWLVKRQKQRQYARVSSVMRGLTLGGTLGAIPATAVAFLLERILPVSMSDRAEWMMTGFFVSLAVSVIWAYASTNLKSYVVWSCVLSALLLILLVAVDAIMLGTVMSELWQSGYSEVAGVSVGLLVIAAILSSVALRMLKVTSTPPLKTA
jgi:uncharacterized iron-regulated membrane protein